MCGLTGFFLSTPDAAHQAHRLAEGGVLTHRGPDAFDSWIDSTKCVGLQHYRLAILDLSIAGAQPMQSACGRYVIVFNGEIYNHLELRSTLDAQGMGQNWRGHSDTESLLASISAWGVSKTLDACVGMFAFAVYDQAERRLTLARDRLGEKPLYYGLLNGVFYFASELKAFKLVAGGTCQLHTGALAGYMRLGYVPGPQSIYKGIFRLAPGNSVTITANDVAGRKVPASTQYWTPQILARRRSVIAETQPLPELLDELDILMRKVVLGQMLSDVPLGALLSGGIDSSLIVAMMQAQSSRPVHTFTIGFENGSVDETPWSRGVAQHLGTNHTELILGAKELIDIVPMLPEIFCEPFADSSQIPTVLVARLARQQVKVALSGDGGDELFAGYDRYFRVENGFQNLRTYPIALRRFLRKAIHRIPITMLDTIACSLGNPGHLKNPGDRLYKIAEVLDSESLSALNRALLTLWQPSVLLPGITEVESVFSTDLPPARSSIERMMLADTLCYLPDDLLVKLDRATMAVSLEGRTPFLDHRVVEYALSLDYSHKVHAGQGKWLLKQLLGRYVPHRLIDRPKQGFGLPVDNWLQGPLRTWAEDLLSTDALGRHCLFDVAVIRKRWKEHLSGSRNWQQHLWTVLMFQAWAEHEGR